MFNACRGEKFSVFIPLSLFLPIPVLESIFFSLIFAQKLYIYLRTDSHYIKSLKQVSPFVKGFEKKNRADFISISSQLWILSRLYSPKVVVSPDQKIFTPTDERGFLPYTPHPTPSFKSGGFETSPPDYDSV